jgi:hypothetical protein
LLANGESLRNVPDVIDFAVFTKWLKEQTGVDDATALQYANLIGDTPFVDEEGLTVIKSGMEVIARVKLDWEQ